MMPMGFQWTESHSAPYSTCLPQIAKAPDFAESLNTLTTSPSSDHPCKFLGHQRKQAPDMRVVSWSYLCESPTNLICVMNIARMSKGSIGRCVEPVITPKNPAAVVVRPKNSRPSVGLLLVALLLAAASLLPATASGQWTVSASNITKNSATLTISGGQQYWRYRRVSPTEGQCISVQGSSQANVSGLWSGAYHVYNITVTAQDCSGENTTVSFRTKNGEPPPPAKIYVSPGGNASVLLQWSSLGNGGVQITKWQYVKKVGNSDFETTWNDICVTANDSSCPTRKTFTVTGLTAGNSYKFKVRAINSIGAGEASAESATVIATSGAPPAPTKPTATVGGGGATLTWASTGLGSSPLTKWQYIKKIGNNDFEGTWIDICTVAVDPLCAEKKTYTVTGLVGGIPHKFKVRAVNSQGVGDASPESDAVTPSGTVTFSVNSVTHTAATLELSGYTRAWWYKGDQTGASCTSVAAGTNSTAIGGLSPESNYTYKLFVYPDCRSGLEIKTVSFTTLQGLAFSGVSINDKYYFQNTPIATETLPEATSGSGSLSYSLSPDLPQGLIFDSGTRELSGTPTEFTARTLYTYTVTDSDDATDALTFAITVEADLVPSFGAESVEEMHFLQNQAIEAIELPSASSGNGFLQYALTPTLPQGLSFDPATRSLSGTPAEIISRTEYTITATDQDGDTDQLTFAITVDADIAPTFSGVDIGIDELTLTQHRSFDAVTLPAAAGGNGILSYAVTPALPEGLSFDGSTRVLSGIPTVTQGKSWYTYQVADEQGDTAEIPFAITIAPNLLPNFGGATIAEQQYKQNRPIENMTLPAASGGDGVVTYSITPSLPEGLSFDPETRVLTGTPTAVLDRTEFTYAATDEEGDAATLPLFITVEGDLAPDFATITEVEHTFKQNRDIGQIVLPAATGGDGQLQYSITPELPRGLTFDGVTRVLSGLPTRELDRTAFTYTAADEDGDTDEVPLYITIEADLMPDFQGVTIAEQVYKQNSDIGQFVLPGAASGDGDLRYSVSPALPQGLTLDATTHTLSGTPTAESVRTKYTYAVTDEDGDAAYLALYITVEADLMPDFEGAAIAEQVYTQNQAIDNLILPEAVSGDGDLSYSLTPTLPEGLMFDAATRTVSGTPAEAMDRTEFTYSVADEDGDSDQLSLHITVEADLMPEFAGAAVAEQQYKQNTPIDALTLPEASGGDGSLTYSLSPALPQGLSFDAATRVVSGTPTAAQDRTEFTYEVTDEDGDAAQLTFHIEVEADLEPSFEGQSIADFRLGRGRAMEPVTLPTATGGDGAIAYVLAPELPGGLSYNAGTRTISGTPNELGGPWTFTYTATDADPIGPDAVSLSFSISVVILEEDKTVLSDILSAQGRALLNGATSAIGRRFSGASNASTGQNGALNTLGGWLANTYSHSGGMGMAPMAGGMHMMPGPLNAGSFGPSVGLTHSSAGLNGIGRMNRGAAWQHLLQDQSFTLSANTASRMQLMRFTVWSAVDYQSFSGASETNDYEGGMASIYLGGDVQFNANWLAGAAVSSNSGTSDYTVMGRSGELKTSLISVYPYVHGRTGSGMELWFIGGFGSGETEDMSQHAGATAEASDLSMTMGAAGIRQPVSQISGMDLSIVGGVGILSLTTKDGQNAIDGLDAGVSQARVGAEIGRNTASMSPYLRLSGRYDGGGSQSGGGLEVVGGLRYASDKIDFEAQGRWLAVHSAADYQEFGGMARLLYKSRADGTGLQMSVQPGWGEANGGALFGRSNSLLGGSNLRTMLPVGREITSQPLVLDNDVGYGFILGQGLLKLGARQLRLGGNARESVGLAWNATNSEKGLNNARDLSLRLDYERPNAYLGGGLRVELRYALRL